MEQDEKKFDYILSDGTKGTIDKSHVTIREWRHYWEPSCTADESDALLAKVTGKPLDWVQGLLLDDWRRLSEAFRNKCREPLDDEKN